MMGGQPDRWRVGWRSYVQAGFKYLYAWVERYGEHQLWLAEMQTSCDIHAHRWVTIHALKSMLTQWVTIHAQTWQQ